MLRRLIGILGVLMLVVTFIGCATGRSANQLTLGGYASVGKVQVEFLTPPPADYNPERLAEQIAVMIKQTTSQSLAWSESPPKFDVTLKINRLAARSGFSQELTGVDHDITYRVSASDAKTGQFLGSYPGRITTGTPANFLTNGFAGALAANKAYRENIPAWVWEQAWISSLAHEINQRLVEGRRTPSPGGRSAKLTTLASANHQ